ncbi:MAG: 50S ribosomal protein L4, partial [Thermoplasmata archaeon]
MEVNVFSLDGKVKEKIELPSIFLGEIREDLIKRAVLSSQSRRFQPKGRDKLAGKRTTSGAWVAGYGVARVHMIKGSR